MPPEIDSKVRKIAQHEKRSANRVLEGLIETGIEAKEAEAARCRLPALARKCIRFLFAKASMPCVPAQLRPSWDSKSC